MRTCTGRVVAHGGREGREAPFLELALDQTREPRVDGGAARSSARGVGGAGNGHLYAPLQLSRSSYSRISTNGSEVRGPSRPARDSLEPVLSQRRAGNATDPDEAGADVCPDDGSDLRDEHRVGVED